VSSAAKKQRQSKILFNVDKDDVLLDDESEGESIKRRMDGDSVESASSFSSDPSSKVSSQHNLEYQYQDKNFLYSKIQNEMKQEFKIANYIRSLPEKPNNNL
jgi:hypothetical protein